MHINLKTSVGDLHALKYGNDIIKPTIVFLHESLGCAELWRDFPGKLGTLTTCNVLVYDRLGYGKSNPFTSLKRANDYLEFEADILIEVLRLCNIDKAILFGHSDGGSISLIAAAKYPSHIIGVIAEAAHIFVEDITLNGIEEAVIAWHKTNLKEKLQKYHGDKTEALFWAWANTWLSDDFKSWNMESFLPYINCPVLAIQGENDEYGSDEQVKGIINHVSGEAKQLIISTVGHAPHKEAEEMVLEHSALFINILIADR